jgi:hypothetical protein
VSDEEYFERGAFLGPDGGWVDKRPGNVKKKPAHPYKSSYRYSVGTNTVLGTSQVLHTFFPGEVRAFARKRGRTGRLSNSEFITWSLRLEVEAGHYERVPVPAPQLPAGVHTTIAQVYDGFLYLLGCRWLHTHGEPAPFSPEFAAAWVGGITPRQAAMARLKLVRLGAIVEVGMHKRAKLWLPGERAA